VNLRGTGPRPRVGARPLVDRDGHYVTTVGPVFVQVRAGAITVADVQEIATHARGFLTRNQGRVAALAVLESTARVPDPLTRDAQQRLLSVLLDDDRVLIAGVVMGEDTDAILRRAVARGLVAGNRRKRTFTDTLEAVQWVAKELELDVGPVTDVLEYARSAARLSFVPPVR
jgi:hypothetical protein